MATMLVGDLPNEILTIYSRDAIFSAMPQLYFRNFVTEKFEFDEPGETVQFLKVANLPAGGRLLSETSPIPKNKYSDSTVLVTVYEYGNAIQLSRRALEASFRPLMADSALLLGRDYGLVMDGVCRDAYLATANKQYAGAKPAVGSIATTGVFNTSEIKSAVETLKTMNAPMINRGGDQFFVTVAHPHQLRNLRDDTSWFNAHAYTDPANIFNGEVGRYENVIFLETTQMPILASAGASSQNIYRAVMFGADCVGFGETVPFGLVNDGVEDFGRLISLGWYTIFGCGIIQDYAVEMQTS